MLEIPCTRVNPSGGADKPMRLCGCYAGRQQHIRYEEVAMPIILWLFGFPVTLALVMWLVDIV